MAASLPDELLARILSPVDSIKSLVQARAVCKSWKTAVEGDQVRALRAAHTHAKLSLRVGAAVIDTENGPGTHPCEIGTIVGRTEGWWKVKFPSSDNIQPRQSSQITTSDEHPLIALTGGGLCGRGYSDDVATNKLSFKFGRDGAWFSGPPMPETRIQHGVVQVGRKLYVVGGVESEHSPPVKRTLVYDVWTATWSDAPGLRHPRKHAVVVALPDSRILVAGGMSDFEPLRSCEIFDPKTETWTAAAPLAEKRWWATGAVLDGSAHVVGGRSSAGAGGESRTMERYDAAADRWDFAPPCPRPTARGCAAVANGKLFVFNGIRDGCLVYRPRGTLELFEEPTVLRRVEMSALGDPSVKMRASHPGHPDHVVGEIVNVDGTRGRIIGCHHTWTPNSNLEYGSGSDDDALPDDASDAGVNAVDVLVTENDAPYAEWLMTWWSEAYRYSEATTALATCAVAGDKILVFGGDCELHSQGDWQYHEDLLADFEDNDQSFLEDLKPKFDNESIDHMYQLGSAGPWFPDELKPATWQRSMDQSEDAAAMVVHM